MASPPTKKPKTGESIEYKMLIDGKLVCATDTFGVHNPSTGQIFAHAPHASETQAKEAVAAAVKAFPKWQAVPLEERKKAMAKAMEMVRACEAELAELVVKEQGKTLSNAKGEVQTALDRAFLNATHIELEDEVYEESADRKIVVRRKPIGVVACITPWNFPVFCACQKCCPAIVLGNTIVLKPSPYTPLTALRLGEILQHAFPPGVINVVTGNDHSAFNVGAYLSSCSDVAKVSFTGSVPTGKSIMRACAGDVRRVTLEMGGNDAAIVRADADVKTVAPGLFAAAFATTGQVCCAAKRIFVHESIFEPLKDELVAIAKRTKIGDGFDPASDYGPLNNLMQLEKVSTLVEDARAQGCSVLAGGTRRAGSDGYFYEPTIVTNIQEGVRLWDEEQFGPVHLSPLPRRLPHGSPRRTAPHRAGHAHALLLPQPVPLPHTFAPRRCTHARPRFPNVRR